MNFKIALDRFAQHLKSLGRSASTVTAYTKDIEQLHTYLKNKKDLNDVKDVNTQDLKDYVNFLKSDKKDYTLKTVSRKINSMKTYFTFLFSENIVESDYAVDVDHPKYEVAPPRVLSKLEYRALRDTARRSRRLYSIIELLLQTGIRIGELARLSISDLKLEGKEKKLNIQSYGSNEAREVELNEEAVRAIEKYLKMRPEPNPDVDSLFVTKNGNPLLVRNIRTSITRAFEKAGIEDATVNDIRNTFIVHQLKHGMPIETLSEIAGHKRLTSTKRYLQFVEDKPKRKTKKIVPL